MKFAWYKKWNKIICSVLQLFKIWKKVKPKKEWVVLFVWLIGFTEWGDDADILAQVIAQSQHEYLASLKKSSATVPKNTDGPPVTGSQDGQATSDDSAVPIADKGKSPMPKDRHT